MKTTYKLSDNFRYVGPCGCVYKITNSITGRFIIGSTFGMLTRMSQYKSGIVNQLMWGDFQKYGVDSFDVEVLYDRKPKSRADIRRIEKLLIKKFCPPYNIHDNSKNPFARIHQDGVNKRIREAAARRNNYKNQSAA